MLVFSILMKLTSQIINKILFRRSSVNQSNKFSRTAIYNSLVLSQEEIAKKSPFQVAAPKTRKYLVLENDFIEAKFSPSSGHLQFLLNKITGVSTKVNGLVFVMLTLLVKNSLQQ